MGARYRGRFAPSPTGALHFGSLVAAIASYLDAKSHQGDWLLRIEDVDFQRTVAGAGDEILRTLDRFGFEWDEEVVFQSARLELYHHALAALKAADLIYPCTCSRREIALRTRQGSIDGGLLYPGTCRAGRRDSSGAKAWRLKVNDALITCSDRVQGDISQNLAEEVGDFILFRADGMFAYQLAVVVDDAAQGITAVVRGADLIDSTARQCWLQACLGYVQPSYAHLPVVVNAQGEKLSKQTGATALSLDDVSSQLVDALNFLGQAAPAQLKTAPVREVWAWALQAWSMAKVPVVSGGPQPPSPI